MGSGKVEVKLVRKKRVEEIDRTLIVEPRLTNDQWKIFIHGFELFNERKFWEAHEAWEEVWWQREEESRIFFQGIIQAAAAYHRLLKLPSYTGALNNFDKALAKLQLFPDQFLGIDVERLRQAIVNARKEIRRLGPQRLREFTHSLIPILDIPEHSEMS